MPAILNDVIGVRGYILEEEGGFWFNRKKRIQCIMDSNPHLHCDLQNGYRLFGKSNSYASARVTGVIADFLIKNPSAEIKDVYNYLQKQSCRKKWNIFSFNKSKRFPEFGDISEINNPDLLNKIADIVMEQQHINDRNIIFEYSLFDLKIGINDINSYYLIKRIEEICDMKIENYTKITRYDFFSIYRIVSFTEKILDQRKKR